MYRHDRDKPVPGIDDVDWRAARESWDKDKRIGDWIHVEDKLPPIEEYVLLALEYYEDEYEVIQGYRECNPDEWFILDPQRQGCKVIAWMPLPEPPEVRDDE